VFFIISKHLGIWSSILIKGNSKNYCLTPWTVNGSNKIMKMFKLILLVTSLFVSSSLKAETCFIQGTNYYYQEVVSWCEAGIDPGSSSSTWWKLTDATQWDVEILELTPTDEMGDCDQFEIVSDNLPKAMAADWYWFARNSQCNNGYDECGTDTYTVYCGYSSKCSNTNCNNYGY
jgi:hypothetical protein